VCFIERRIVLEYTKPAVVDLGTIADHTFTTPGGHKGCTTNCHIDSFGEQSGLTGA
jgi:hypothetical protein